LQDDRRGDERRRLGRKQYRGGSRFHFSAWVDRSEGQHEDEWKPCSLLHEKILLVDDNLTHVEILKDDLQSLGVRVITLTSGERVVSTLKEAVKMGDPFTFCFIDTQIPFEGGGDAAREIRQSEIPNLLLIALSSTLEPHLQGWERDVYDDFLIKPVRKEKIYQILGKLRGGRKKEKQRGKNLEEFRAAGGGGRQEDNGSLHLLVVEDNLVNQKLATKILEKFGCRVDVASNGVEALEKVKRIPYDLVFMDCHMTEMDGYDATIEIRRREGASKHTPIVAMTANSIKGDRERCIEVGMDDYISKPIKKEMVYEMVKKWCQG
jgi:two-component system, sensor histidine kinase and response regulator